MRKSASLLATVVTCVTVICATGTAFGQSPAQTFDSPDAAAAALVGAAEKGDTAALSALFGPASRTFLSAGDTKQDQEERAEFARLARSKLRLEPDPMNRDRVVIAVGSQDWPFPVPVMRVNGKWSFDASQGQAEIRDRRIGANELSVVEICAGYVEAQTQFAARNPHGDRAYAQSIGELGEVQGLVPQRFVQAATDAHATPPAKPYHGYYFRILKAQGPNAPGGAHRYIVKAAQKELMMGGFALLAWPAQYGVSGVHAFIVNQDAVIFEKDLAKGLKSSAPATLVTRFDPDHTWTRVE